MKKIAIVRYNLSNIGGAEKVAINMANELSRYYDVRLMSILLNEDGFINYDIDPVSYTHLTLPTNREV